MEKPSDDDVRAGENTKKRPAGEKIEKAAPKRRFFSLSWLRSPAPPVAKTPAAATDAASIAAGVSTTDIEVVRSENDKVGDKGKNAKQNEQAPEDDQPPPIPVDREAIQIRQARLIDEYFERQRIEQEDKELKARGFQPHILPYEADFGDFKSKAHAALKKGKGRVQEVMDAMLTEEQRLLLIPPTINGAILEIQNEKTKEYKELVGEGGRFYGQGDNIATKFTMLHFGLPVEPLTMNNIINAGKDEGGGREELIPMGSQVKKPVADDPPDDPEEMPRVQRIMFSEKPLEFLDSYHERSYGYPILRRMFVLSFHCVRC